MEKYIAGYSTNIGSRKSVNQDRKGIKVGIVAVVGTLIEGKYEILKMIGLISRVRLVESCNLLMMI